MLKFTEERPLYTRKMRVAANPCGRCGKTFEVPVERVRRQKFCSIACSNARFRVDDEGKKCRKCQKVYAHSDFPSNGHGGRTASCKDCYRPRVKHGEKQLIEGKAPCAHCGERFFLPLPRCRVMLRKFCSEDCAAAHLRKPTHTCKRCRKTLPAEDFDYVSSGKNRASACRECRDTRLQLKEDGIGYIAPLNEAIWIAKNGATARKIPYTLSFEQAQALYGSPCDLCGGKGCVFRTLSSALGFVPGNVEVSCWVCSRWANAQRGSISTDDVVRHAKAIVRYHSF